MAGYARVLEGRDPATAPERLRELASDEFRTVRMYAAENFSMPPDALELLIRDTDSSVRWCAFTNPAAPASGLAWLAAQDEPSAHFRYSEIIAHHPGASAELRAAITAAGGETCGPECQASIHTRPSWVRHRKRQP
jgi:hypothetical protein